MANLQINVLANLGGFTQIRQAYVALETQLKKHLDIEPVKLSSLQTFRSAISQGTIAVAALAAAFTGMSAAAISAFASQETAFAGVRKTLEATGPELQQIQDNFTAMSNRIPVPFEDLSRIAELAGQLGVEGVADVTKFTETVARIAASSNLSAEAAATGLAKIANAMQEPIANVDRMAASMVGLAISTVSTEQDIINFAERIAGVGKLAGMSTADIFGISAAFASVGIKAEAGGTSIQKMITTMIEAVAVGGEKLQLLAELIDVPAEKFQELFKADPAKVFGDVIRGIAGAGDKAFGAIAALGGANERLTRALLTAGGAGDKFNETIAKGNVEWEKGNAHLNASNERFKTWESSVTTLKNAINNLARAFGETLMPALQPMVNTVRDVMVALQGLSPEIKTVLAAITAITAGLFLLIGIAGTVVIGLAALKVSAGALGTTVGALALLFGKTLIVIGLVTAAIYLLVKAYQWWTGATDGQKASADKLDAQLKRTDATVAASGATAKLAGDRVRASGTAAQEGVSGWQAFATATKEVISGLFALGHDLDQAIIAGLKTSIKTLDTWGHAIDVAIVDGLKTAIQAVDAWGHDIDTAIVTWATSWGNKLLTALHASNFHDGWRTFWQTTSDILGINLIGMMDQLVAWENRWSDWIERTIVAGIEKLRNYGKQRLADLGVTTPPGRGASGSWEGGAGGEGFAFGPIPAGLTGPEGFGVTPAARASSYNRIDATQAKPLLDDIIAQYEKVIYQERRYMMEIEHRFKMTEISEADFLAGTLKSLTARGAAAEERYEKEIALAGRLADGEAELRTKALKEKQAATLEILGMNFKYEQDVRAMGNRLEAFDKAIIDKRITMEQAASTIIIDLRQKQIEFIADLEATDFQRFARQERAKAFTDASKIEADMLEAGATLSQIVEATKIPFQNADAAITNFLKKDYLAKAREVDGLRAAFGLLGEEAFRASEAHRLEGKSYDQLTDAQKRWVDQSAEALEKSRLLRIESELLTATTKRAYDLFEAGMAKTAAVALAVRAELALKAQKDIDQEIQALNIVNNHYQVMEQKNAQLLMERGQNETDFYKFSIGAAKKWAAQQDTIWQAYDKMIANVLGNVQRTLSDIFFNMFTGQEFKLKDMFKALLDSMLREIANFMAAAAVKGFITFLGNLSQGKTVGESASGALGSLLGGSGGTGSNAANPGGTAASTVSVATTLISRALEAFGLKSPSTPAPTGTVSLGTGMSGGSGSLWEGAPVSFGPTVQVPSLSGYGGGNFDFGAPYSSSIFQPQSSFSVPEPSYYDYSSYAPDYTSYNFAEGGKVPGSGRGDIVPAMLEPGEFVVRRSVAEQLGPALDQLNEMGAPTVSEGRLHFATGGTVPALGPGSITNEALLTAILAALNKQTATAQVIAQNTGQTTMAVTTIAKDATGGANNVPPWIAPPSMSGPSEVPKPPSTLESIVSSGVISSGLRTVGSGANALGFGGAAQGAVALAGLASIYQGIQNSNSYQIAGGGLTSASALAGLLSRPGVAEAVGLTPQQAQAAGLISQGLNVGTGVLGVVQGIQTGNTLGAVTGGVQTAAAVSNILASPTAASLFGYGTGGVSFDAATGFAPTLGGAFGVAGGALGAVGGGLQLFQGIKNEDIGQIAQGAYQAGTGVYSVLSTLYPATFTPISTLAADALIAVAPSIASTLGITGSTGAGVAAGSIAAGAAATGFSAAAAPVAGSLASAAVLGAEAGIVGGAAVGGAAGYGGVAAAGASAGVGLAAAAVAWPLLLYAAISLLEMFEPNLFKDPPSSNDISKTISDMASFNVNTAIQNQQDTQGLIALLNTEFAPHGELQIGSTGFGWAGDYNDPRSETWGQALGALYDPATVAGGQGLPWAEAFIRGLWVKSGPTGTVDDVDEEAIWKLQYKIATTLPNLPAYAGIKTAVSPGGDLWAAEQVRLAEYLKAAASIYTPSFQGPTGATITAQPVNRYDPYTDTVFRPDGSTFLLSHQLIFPTGQSGSSTPSRGPGINPFTYDPMGYGGQSWSSGFEDASLNLSGGMAAGGPVFSTRGRALWGRDTEHRLLEPGEWVIPRRIAAGNTERLDSLVRTGRWSGDEVHRVPMSDVAAAHERATPVTQGAFTFQMPPITININGNVTNPKETAAAIVLPLRDELHRVEARFSRVGNKKQG